MRSIVFFSFLFICALATAQDSTAVLGNGATVKQDMKIFEVQEDYKDYNISREFNEGYRIQITFTNVRDEIYKAKSEMYREFPALTSYVEYEQPDYKLRLGDFATRLEASYYLQQIVLTHPGAFIVKDKIKIK